MTDEGGGRTFGLSVLGARLHPGDTEKEASENAKRESKTAVERELERQGFPDKDKAFRSEGWWEEFAKIRAAGGQ